MTTAVMDKQKKDERLGFRATREVKEIVETCRPPSGSLRI